MELRIEDLLAFPMQIAEHVRMGVAEANSFKQECADMSKKVERLVQLLRQAARFSSGNNNLNNYSAGLYERPAKRIMLEVTKALERVLVLVKKCKRSGILKRVMTITNTADFRKVNLLLESSIGDVTWLLNISTSGEDRPECIGLPPIAATDPILGLVWEQVSIVHVGTPDQKADAAVYLENLAKDNERNVQIIIEEGGVLPLLWLLKEGTVSGQEAAARALGQLARDQEQVKAMRDVGACAAFTHILGNHATSMKVQSEVAWAISQFASQDDEAQEELASLGAIRLLVALLAHDLIDETSLKVANKSTSIHSIVKNIGQKKTVGSGAGGGNASTTDLDQRVDDFNNKMGEEQVPVLDGLANSTHSQKVYPTKQASALHQGNQNHRDKEDPKIKLMLKAEAAHALWKLAKNNIKNSKQITDTRALLCFAKLIETDQGMVKYNSIMAIMEIAAAAERDKELRRAAFKTNSTAVKAVVECLLRVLEQEADEPDLQAPCAKALGSLAHIFPAPARPQITALTLALGSEEPNVAAEGAIALCKFADNDNYLHMEHSRTILEAGATDHLVQLVNFGEPYVQIHALRLLCYLSLNAADSDALGKAATLPALLTFSRSQLFTKYEDIRQLLMDAIAKLELYQLGSSHGRSNSVP
ncbi:unnamed protein product [Sphagnum troendelagicum]|uniref:DUF7792 domain-containing protein n=1 Tax=Sphagnum troendelagicum TaxID=128251 RepID=A0ABP0ULX9_9BRYO